MVNINASHTGRDADDIVVQHSMTGIDPPMTEEETIAAARDNVNKTVVDSEDYKTVVVDRHPDNIDHDNMTVMDYCRHEQYNVIIVVYGPYGEFSDGETREAHIAVPELEFELGHREAVIDTIQVTAHSDTTLSRTSRTSVYDPDVPDGYEIVAFEDDGYFLTHSNDRNDETTETKDETDPLQGGWDGRDWVDSMEIRQSKTVEPPENQHRLKDYRGVTQAEVNPDAIPADALIDDLPAFIDLAATTEIWKKAKDPTTGSLDECDHCHESDPWHHPLERGVCGLRPGSPEEGDPDRNQCPDDEIKRCDCCGCPFCGGKSIRQRDKYEGTVTGTYACNSCKHEFDNPVDRPQNEDVERTRLFWRCGECGAATRAPFDGLPRDLVSDPSQ